ncbi:hypothetical protein ACSSS7_002426 [Eimeria intestinalis]
MPGQDKQQQKQQQEQELLPAATVVQTFTHTRLMAPLIEEGISAAIRVTPIEESGEGGRR